MIFQRTRLSDNKANGRSYILVFSSHRAVMLMGKCVSGKKYQFYEYLTAVMISAGVAIFLLCSGDHSTKTTVTTFSGRSFSVDLFSGSFTFMFVNLQVGLSWVFICCPRPHSASWLRPLRLFHFQLARRVVLPVQNDLLSNDVWS